jgi:hypothetical protein
VFGGEMGPYYFCLAMKLGFISADTQTLRLAVLSQQQTELCNTYSDTIAQTPVIFLKDKNSSYHKPCSVPSLNVVGYILPLTEIHYTNNHAPLVIEELCDTDQ